MSDDHSVSQQWNEKEQTIRFQGSLNLTYFFVVEHNPIFLDLATTSSASCHRIAESEISADTLFEQLIQKVVEGKITVTLI